MFGLGRPADAVPALEEAARLAPGDAPVRVDLAVALASAGRLPEAVSASDEARGSTPRCSTSRPGARAVLDAAREGSAGRIRRRRKGEDMAKPGPR